MSNKEGCLYYFIYILIAFVFLFIYSGILMWLWNSIMVAVFCLPALSYWQAMGIYIISNILFKNSFSLNTKELNKND
jgi:hypothetical protein